jgi:hypothetical protein
LDESDRDQREEEQARVEGAHADVDPSGSIPHLGESDHGQAQGWQQVELFLDAQGPGVRKGPVVGDIEADFDLIKAPVAKGRILTLPPNLVGRDSVEPLQRELKFSGSSAKAAQNRLVRTLAPPLAGGSVKMRPEAEYADWLKVNCRRR